MNGALYLEVYNKNIIKSGSSNVKLEWIVCKGGENVMRRDNIDEIRKLFIGLDNKIVINGKKQIIPINFDNAATTPVLKKVMSCIKS